MSDRTIEVGVIIEDYYDSEDSERVAALDAHWEELEPREETAPRETIRRWRVVANPPPPPPTPADLIAEYDAALEARIDDALRARGYTKREPSDYAGSVVPRYRQDAIDYELCRDRIMCAGYDMLNEYLTTGRIPTKEEFLAALPTLTWTIDPDNTNPGEGMYIPG